MNQIFKQIDNNVDAKRYDNEMSPRKHIPIITIDIVGPPKSTPLYTTLSPPMNRPRVTFCFLVTRELEKEKLWRIWFDELDNLDFPYHVIAHCSNRHLPNIDPKGWLFKYLIPEHVDTRWGCVMNAQLALYRVAQKDGSSWITVHSESCVPFVSAQNFIRAFDANHHQSLIHWRTIPAASLFKNPGNMLNIPKEHRIKHDQWCVLTRRHVETVLQFASESKDAQDMLSDAVFAADEHFVGVALSIQGELHNVKSTMSTVVDWTEDRVENEGGSPHTFHGWSYESQCVVRGILENVESIPLFFRKVSKTFPDHVVLNIFWQ